MPKNIIFEAEYAKVFSSKVQIYQNLGLFHQHDVEATFAGMFGFGRNEKISLRILVLMIKCEEILDTHCTKYTKIFAYKFGLFYSVFISLIWSYRCN